MTKKHRIEIPMYQPQVFPGFYIDTMHTAHLQEREALLRWPEEFRMASTVVKIDVARDLDIDVVTTSLTRDDLIELIYLLTAVNAEFSVQGVE